MCTLAVLPAWSDDKEKAEAAIDAKRLVELDAYWEEITRTVREGDFAGYAATCHPEAVLVSGVRGNSTPLSEALKRWKKEFGTLLYALRTRYPEARLYWHQAIDMSGVPALPTILGRVLNLRVKLLNRKGAQLCVERGAICVPPLPSVNPDGFCRDGFHANEAGYDAWADHMIAHFDYTPRTSPAAKPFL